MKKSILILFILFLSVNSYSLESCVSLLSSNVQNYSTNILNNEFPKTVYQLETKVLSGEILPEDLVFIFLPGNMGETWSGTNHNVGYDSLESLLKHYGASGTRDKGPVSGPIETLSFNTKDMGDDTDFFDKQFFFSESGYSRTRSGELFYVEVQGGKTLVFMRSIGFYNNGGNFVVPAIEKIGGTADNLVVIHDDLHATLGEIVTQERSAEYNGNRAILSVHNNLNALRLYRAFDESKADILRKLTEGFGDQADQTMIELDPYLEELKKTMWSIVVEVKNTQDEVQFRSSLMKAFKPILTEYFKTKLVALGSMLSEELSLISEKQRAIASAEDKRVANQEFQVFKKNLVESSESLAHYFLIQETLKDLESKQSKIVLNIIALFANEFDPRVMDTPFSSIGIGTGYEQWLAAGQSRGFSEISPFLEEGSEIGGFPHFVLSQRDEHFDTNESFEALIQTIESLIKGE